MKFGTFENGIPNFHAFKLRNLEAWRKHNSGIFYLIDSLLIICLFIYFHKNDVIK